MVFSRILLWLLILFSVVGLILAYFRFMEKRIVFIPTQEIENLPTDIGLVFEDINFETGDNLKLNGWFIPQDQAICTILFCHGNGGNISHRLEEIKFFNEVGANVFIFDYRGYGKSEGSPSENGLYNDCLCAYRYLLSRGINSKEIVGFGESLGGAIAIDLANHNEISGLILFGTISSAKDMAKHLYPFLPYWVFSSHFDSVNKIKSIRIPKLIIHSREDEIVPYELARKLYENSAQPKELFEVTGSHNDSFYESRELLREKISAFLKRVSN